MNRVGATDWESALAFRMPISATWERIDRIRSRERQLAEGS